MAWITGMDLGYYNNISNKETVEKTAEIIKKWALDRDDIKSARILHNVEDTYNVKRNRVLEIVTTSGKAYLYKMVCVNAADTRDDYMNSLKGLPYNKVSSCRLQRFETSGWSCSSKEELK